MYVLQCIDQSLRIFQGWFRRYTLIDSSDVDGMLSRAEIWDLLSPQKMDLTYKYHCFQWKLETIHGILLADIETGFGTAATLSPFQACVSDTHSTLCGCTSHMLGYCTKLTTPPISRLSSPNFESLAPQKVNSKSHCEMVDSNDPFRTWQLPVVFDPPKCPKIVSPDFSGQEFLQIM